MSESFFCPTEDHAAKQLVSELTDLIGRFGQTEQLPVCANNGILVVGLVANIQLGDGESLHIGSYYEAEEPDITPTMLPRYAKGLYHAEFMGGDGKTTLTDAIRFSSDQTECSMLQLAEQPEATGMRILTGQSSISDQGLDRDVERTVENFLEASSRAIAAFSESSKHEASIVKRYDPNSYPQIISLDT